MDPPARFTFHDTSCIIPVTSVSNIGSIYNSDSFNIFLPQHHGQLTSANSIELNAAASLSDDSGVPLTTNSSISSGDSYRLGICKFKTDIVESDGEVSQFDSLENCSEGGMSAENFNTLKKGPLAPIDPPPEFQDSPPATLVHSINRSGMGSLRRWTSSQSSFEHFKEYNSDERNEIRVIAVCNDEMSDVSSNYKNELQQEHFQQLKHSYAISKYLYSSDSVLNIHTDNLYDEPNNVLSSSLGNNGDFVESESPSLLLPTPPPPVSIAKIKQSTYPCFPDHTRYFKAIPSEQDNIPVANRFNTIGLSDIHDHIYYSVKRNIYQQNLFPLSGSNYRSQIYHGSICSNRPNSRNSLNSRLSSSHNSLSRSSSNKRDDSIFITQAMSHDTLLTREISDFYNVPVDSDIYALPVDMVKSDTACAIHRHFPNDVNKKMNHMSYDFNNFNTKCSYHQKLHRKKRNRRKKRFSANCLNSGECGDGNEDADNNEKVTNKLNTARYTPTFQLDNHEPLHMTLKEVKQFYHTLYSESKSAGESISLCHSSLINSNAVKSSNDTIWSEMTARSRITNTICSRKSISSISAHIRNLLHKQTTLTGRNDIDNSNNNIIIVNNSSTNIHNNNNNNKSNNKDINEHLHVLCNSQSVIGVEDSKEQSQLINVNLSNTKKQHTGSMFANEKKSQFSLNLKQKFCSIFRFRRNSNRFRSSPIINSTTTDEHSNELIENSKRDHIYISNIVKRCSEEKQQKFQSRALPPLPKRGIEQNRDRTNENSLESKDLKRLETRSNKFQFTSSIEKVKDYGWYWGPLSSEAAEKVLSNEPDGSFIVRDSSDDHYIFSLSFKLNNCVRHVRIEQDQGTFSFGSYAKFKSQTITEFIEKAVEHSRSGRYLFFLHRRPEHGPMRVQLTNPVSRFKHVQSLQHMCRFVIVKAVIRKDLLQTLPLPRRLLDYLNYKHCYSEQVESDSSHSQLSGDGPL